MSVYTSKSATIIDQERYNGRVNIISQQPDPNAFFKMQERIAIKNTATNYCSAMSGNDWEDSILSKAYFSKENIQILQNGLRAGVYAMSGNKFVIPPQNIDALKVIMRSYFLQYAEYIPDVTAEIQKLNQLVLDYAIPSVYSEAMGYAKYAEDQSSLVLPLDMPIHVDRQYKQLELKPWF
jgi:hypothetical protein